MDAVLSANDRLVLLSGVWQSIIAIENLSSVASSVRGVTKDCDFFKIIQNGLPVLRNTLNEIQASLLLKIEKDAEENESDKVEGFGR